MNKYQEAIKVVDIVLHHMCGEEREDGYLPTMEEMSKSMDLLKDLANKADLFEWIPFPPKDEVTICLDYLVPEVDEEILVSDGEDVWQDRWLVISKGYDYDYELDSEIDFEGLAWMPLPKPYKEKENER